MSYKVRLLTPSEKVISFNTLEKLSDRIKLVSGTDALWDKLEIHDSHDILFSTLEHDIVSSGSNGESTLKDLIKAIQDRYPVNDIYFHHLSRPYEQKILAYFGRHPELS